MFDFLAHWFAKTETIINNNGTTKEGKWTHFKNGHYSLDLMFITIVLVLGLVYFLYQLRKQYLHKIKLYKNINLDRNYNLPLLDIVPQSPFNLPRSESNVARAPSIYPDMRQCPTKLCSKADCNQLHN